MVSDAAKTIWEALKPPGDIDRIKECLEEGVEVNCRNRHGSTPLILAAIAGQDEIVKFLLESRADVNAQDHHGWTALLFTCAYSKTSTSKILLAHPDINVTLQNVTGGTALILASHSSEYVIVKALIDRGADVNAKQTIGLTPLMMATDAGHRKIVQLLLDSGACVDDNDNMLGAGPIHAAVSNGDYAILDVILNKKANLDLQTHTGLTPLMIASCKGQLDLSELLLKHGASPNIQERKSVLGASLYNRRLGSFNAHLSHVKKMTSMKAAPHQPIILSNMQSIAHRQVLDRIGEGSTALHYAAREGDAPMVKLLLQHGADPRIANKAGYTAIDVAQRHERTSCIHIIADYLAKE